MVFYLIFYMLGAACSAVSATVSRFVLVAQPSVSPPSPRLRARGAGRGDLCPDALRVGSSDRTGDRLAEPVDTVAGVAVLADGREVAAAPQVGGPLLRLPATPTALAVLLHRLARVEQVGVGIA